jgi:hypothetical protein
VHQPWHRGGARRARCPSVTLAVGDHYVRFEHPNNYDFTYRVTLHYLILV